jgi:hypothetical protein
MKIAARRKAKIMTLPAPGERANAPPKTWHRAPRSQAGSSFPCHVQVVRSEGLVGFLQVCDRSDPGKLGGCHRRYGRRRRARSVPGHRRRWRVMSGPPADQQRKHDGDSDASSTAAGRGWHRGPPGSAAKPYPHEPTAPVPAAADPRGAGRNPVAAYLPHPHNDQPAGRRHATRSYHDFPPFLCQFRRPRHLGQARAGVASARGGSARRPRTKDAGHCYPDRIKRGQLLSGPNEDALDHASPGVAAEQASSRSQAGLNHGLIVGQ